MRNWLEGVKTVLGVLPWAFGIGVLVWYVASVPGTRQDSPVALVAKAVNLPVEAVNPLLPTGVRGISVWYLDDNSFPDMLSAFRRHVVVATLANSVTLLVLLSMTRYLWARWRRRQ